MMGNQRVLGLHLVFLSMVLVATEYTCLGAQNSTESCHERERHALLEFKHSVEDEFGMLSSWVGTNCCSWKGVRCDGATGSIISLHLMGNYKDNIEEYISLEEDYYLVGDRVNTYLAELRHLKHLDLSGNNFQGSQIPEFIGSFKQLSYLNLSLARFSGIIPHHIGNLSNLKVLDLSSNYPLITNDVAWVSSLSSLDHLDLSFVDLSQAKYIEVVFHIIPSLTYLSLRDCRLSADLGLHLNVNSSKILPNIQHLDLGLNDFKGQLPHFFHNMTSLLFLDLSYYDLSLSWNSLKLLNTIPSLLELHMFRCGLNNTHFSSTYFNSSAQPNLHYLDLGYNSIGGRFPSVLMNMTSLRVIDLSYNSLNSSIPVMPNLLNLYVSHNNFDNIELVGVCRQCHLKELRLSSNHFGGEMIGSSPNTSECSQYALEMLDIFDSQLNGSVPESIGRLTNLRVLNLKSKSLTGTIPKALDRLRSLEVLDLSNNAFTGSIPESFGRLTNLRVLNLNENSFIGAIPESLGRLTGLTRLDLESNRLTGAIPTSIGSLDSLQMFSLASNLLTGPIPVSVGQLTKLVHVDFCNNSLEGVVFEAHFANLSMLKSLKTHDNYKLICNISHEWTPPFQLREINFGSCKIANEFPKWLQTQRKLQELRLSNASLHGLLPTFLRKMPMLYHLDLSHNKFSGSLINFPISINMLDLILQDNLFGGSLPRSLCRSTDLMILDVSSNRLSGNIPDCVGNLRQLMILFLNSNRLSGVLPSSLGNISSSLFWLKLNDCNFNGEIPPSLGNLGSLKVLDLGNNEFSGSIPKWIGEKLDLTVLRLHKNNFTGGIPQSLCKRTSLKILDVSSNQLSGSIPKCVENLHDLELLILGSNRLSGVLPSSLGNISSSLRWLQLNDCNFTGELPPNLGNLGSLDVLDLGNNEFSGSIPKWIGKTFTNLTVLRLHKNFFTGGIPQSLCRCAHLHILDIAHNNLKGSIPRCLEELRGMIDETSMRERYSYIYSSSGGVIDQVMKGIQLGYTTNLDLVRNIDLSSNKLTGEIPPEVTALASLVGLNLSHNHLSGSIPDKIGNMKALFSLDLSDNLLTGMIPPSTADLNFLSFMNLSHNKLSGRIPTGNQLQTLNDPSMYAGNRDLCGAPLPNNCSNHEDPPTTISKSKYEPKKVLFYLDITGGFATGFWGIIGVLLFKKEWRRKLFMIAEVAKDKIYVMVAVRVSKIKRWREAQ